MKIITRQNSNNKENKNNNNISSNSNLFCVIGIARTIAQEATILLKKERRSRLLLIWIAWQTDQQKSKATGFS